MEKQSDSAWRLVDAEVDSTKYRAHELVLLCQNRKEALRKAGESDQGDAKYTD